ncbi:MAG: SGNH/GDSL hydrolase family protein [Rhizobiales bacterium]|nr:SGNH/GDSL hydrolase family protein [Hyphomicrobiales bacterium]MBO6700393.1 SGNH/GDSL hydrolase family protein [Hyphomicrobiales bacterium]MBO6737929.1 SGNH/GDSL hydrolase family protein [Hyphomicrobiales bacterium]MBO6913764.1 SGNH/GDSL hydrolase family protein [Hyphomicrobiales bacterium]MBO6954341.1 SGNH/GDSL hydrolase family protein [Hyphomicrobiales bacterium]
MFGRLATDGRAPRENALARIVRSNRLKAWASWLLLPVCFWQGLRIRRSTISLLPPNGPVDGLVGGHLTGKAYRVLIIGDSSVSSIGAADLDDGLAMQMATRLSDRLNRPIALRISGNSSATSADLRDHVVPNLPNDAFDLVFVVIGMNDAKNFHTARRFIDGFGGLIYAMKARFPSAMIAHWPISPMTIFPVLPQPLKTCLTFRSDVLDALAACLSAGRGIERFERRMTFPQSGFAADGFHVNAEGYALWAEEAVNALMSKDPVRRARKKRKDAKRLKDATPYHPKQR